LRRSNLNGEQGETQPHKPPPHTHHSTHTTRARLIILGRWTAEWHKKTI